LNTVKNQFTSNLIQEITQAKKRAKAQTAEDLIPMKPEFAQLLNSTKIISSIVFNYLLIHFLNKCIINRKKNKGCRKIECSSEKKKPKKKTLNLSNSN
jgi:hypothetical protein